MAARASVRSTRFAFSTRFDALLQWSDKPGETPDQRVARRNRIIAALPTAAEAIEVPR